MDLIINKHIIDTDAEVILRDINRITSGRYLSDIIKRGDNIAITCPNHKNGMESHPSCYVYNDRNSSSVPFGWYRCFTCGSQGPLQKLVAKCLDTTISEAEQWLIDNYSHTFSEQILDLPSIDINKDNTVKNILDESILDNYAFYHPYMFKRGLTEEVILKFKIGFNKETNSITFPVWDEHNDLVGITERNVDTKYFHIPTNMGKPVYLLNYIMINNIQEVIVCESQLDALKCWVWGKPAIALFGTGSKKQYEILNRSGIRFYHLAFDGDMAGEHGAKRFLKNIRNDVFIDIIKLPENKDVNDLTEEEFNALQHLEREIYL